MAKKIIYFNICGEDRIKPHKFSASTKDKKKKKLLKEALKTLPILKICGVSGCRSCVAKYTKFVDELKNNYNCDSIELYRVEEPDIKIWILK